MRSALSLAPTTLFVGVALLASTYCISAQENDSIAKSRVEIDSQESAPPERSEISIGAFGSWTGTGQSQSVPQTGANNGQSNPADGQASAPNPNSGKISGTVTDENGDLIPGASVALNGPTPGDSQRVVANDNGLFELVNLSTGIAYHVTVDAKGFEEWKSSDLVLQPGQFLILTDIKLKIVGVATTVIVSSSQVEIATEQVHVEEQQRVFGFIPNFYIVYDPDAVPLTTKLKFKLALKVSVDPVSFAGAAFFGGINQAADRPNYVQGLKGYGERVGTVYADAFSDLIMGGAILPSVLRQDPRYFYQGTGTKKSRALHAISNPFICKGDDGRWQPNFSSMGGDLFSSALSNAYYPASNRGVGLFVEGFAVNTGERVVSSLIQEFVLRKFTSGPSDKK